MSEDSKTAEIKTSGNADNKTHDKLTRQEIIKGVGVLLVLVALVVAGFWWHAYTHIPTDAEINKAAVAGNYAKQEKLLQKAISKSNDKTQKAGLYQELAGTYANDKQSSQAIQAYQQAADQTGMTAGIARNIGDIYADKGDKQKAVTYYQQAISLWPKDDPLHDAEIRSLQLEIKGLQS